MTSTRPSLGSTSVSRARPGRACSQSHGRSTHGPRCQPGFLHRWVIGCFRETSSAASPAHAWVLTSTRSLAGTYPCCLVLASLRIDWSTWSKPDNGRGPRVCGGLINPANARSISVAERLGMSPARDIRRPDTGEVLRVYRLSRCAAHHPTGSTPRGASQGSTAVRGSESECDWGSEPRLESISRSWTAHTVAKGQSQACCPFVVTAEGLACGLGSLYDDW